MMTGKIPIPEENVKFIVKDLTPERILRYIDVEDIIRNIDVEVLQKLPDALLKSFSRDELKKFQKLLNEKIAEDDSC
jgi:hypothetical protein